MPEAQPPGTIEPSVPRMRRPGPDQADGEDPRSRRGRLARLVLVLNAIPLLLLAMRALAIVPVGDTSVFDIAAFLMTTYGALIGVPTTVVALAVLAIRSPTRRLTWLAGLVLFIGCGVGLALSSAALRTRALHRAVAGATRLRVRTGGGCHRSAAGEKTLIDVTDPEQIRSIVAKIRVSGGIPGIGGHCMCCGWPTLEFYEGNRLLAMVSCHHGSGLRWHDGKWDGDANLTSGSAGFLDSWLRENGATVEQWKARQPAANEPE